MMMNSIVSEESFARDTHTDRQTDRQTRVSSKVKCVKVVADDFANQKGQEGGDWQRYSRNDRQTIRAKWSQSTVVERTLSSCLCHLPSPSLPFSCLESIWFPPSGRFKQMSTKTLKAKAISQRLVVRQRYSCSVGWQSQWSGISRSCSCEADVPRVKKVEWNQYILQLWGRGTQSEESGVKSVDLAVVRQR